MTGRAATSYAGTDSSNGDFDAMDHAEVARFVGHDVESVGRQFITDATVAPTSSALHGLVCTTAVPATRS